MQNQHHKFIAVQCDLDHIHGAAIPSRRKQYINTLFREIEFKGRDGCELGKPYEHIKKLPIPMTDKPRIQLVTTYLQCAAYQLRLTGGTTRRTPRVLTHRATMDAAPLLTNDTRLYLLCFVSLMYYVLDLLNALLLEAFFDRVRAPTTGPMEALRKVTRYLLESSTSYSE